MPVALPPIVRARDRVVYNALPISFLFFDISYTVASLKCTQAFATEA